MKQYKQALKTIAKWQVKHPYITLFIILAITLALYGGVADVRTVASLEQMMPPQVEEIRAFNELRDNYMGQDMIAVIIEVNSESTDPEGFVDVRDQEVQEYIEHLSDLLRQEADIREVYSSSDVLKAASKSGSIKDIQKYDMIISNPQVQSQLGNFINDDASIAIIIASTDVSADDTRMSIMAGNVLNHLDSAGHPPGLKTHVTGTPVVQQKLGELIAQDRKNTQLISTILVFLITMLLFGTFTSALVPIIVVTISVNWLYGIMGYAGIPISTLAGGVAAMVIGIGIDYAIHLMNKFKNERKAGKDKEASIVAAVQDTGTALTGAAIATILAFIAFLLGDMPEMNRFGLLMGIGVSSAFLLSITALPAMLIIEERIIERLRKRMHFGPEGNLVLYDADEVHPEDQVPHEPTIEELKDLAKKYKVCKKK